MSITDTKPATSPFLDPTETLILRATANLLSQASERMWDAAMNAPETASAVMHLGRMRGEMDAAKRGVEHALAVLLVDAESRQVELAAITEANLADIASIASEPGDE